MRIDATCSENLTFPCNHFRGSSQRNGNIGLYIWIPCLANFPDTTILYTDISFHNAPPIDNKCIGNNGISNIICQQLGLSHAISNDFTTTEFNFFTISGQVLFDFNKQFRVRQANTISYCWSEHFRICTT